MSESDDTTESPSKDVPAPPTEVEAPKLAYVKGGTGTQRSEDLYARRFEEAEERRDIAARQDAESRDQQDVKVPGGADGKSSVKMPGHAGGAVQYTSQMTAHPEVPKAYVLLKYLTRTGSIMKVGGEPVECMADIIVGADPDHPTELCLILVCPKCEADTHKHSQDNQLRIFQSNKYFELAAGKGQQRFMFQGQTYLSAGVITESERFDCPDCGWRARIEENFVRPD